MVASDWIAAVQALFLAAAAWFAWRGYSIAAEDRRQEPIRRVVLDVIAEVKELTVSDWSGAEFMRRQLRMRVALGFVPPGSLPRDLFYTRQLANMELAMGSPIYEAIELATRELADVLGSIDAGKRRGPSSIRRKRP